MHKKYIKSNPLLNKNKINISSNSQIKTNNMDSLLIGTQKINQTHLDKNLIKQYELKYKADGLKFKDKNNYLSNTPYKAIHSQEYFKKKINSSEDLVIYKVSNSRNNKIIEKNIAKVINDRKKFDIQQNQEYTTDKKEIYEHNFNNELNNRFYNVINTQQNQEQLKKDSYKYHEKCQQKLEENKQNIDQIIDDLIDKPLI
jgi:hypothetical protein